MMKSFSIKLWGDSFIATKWCDGEYSLAPPCVCAEKASIPAALPLERVGTQHTARDFGQVGGHLHKPSAVPKRVRMLSCDDGSIRCLNSMIEDKNEDNLFKEGLNTVISNVVGETYLLSRNRQWKRRE